MEGDVTNSHESSKNNADNTEQNSTDKNVKDPSATTASDSQQNKNESDDDVVFIQDLGFTVIMSAPGLEPFDIHVSPQELVHEIHQILMDREDTCHRTCFSLQLEGNTLDNFAELKNISGLKEKSLIKIVEEPYTIREARIHVRHVRDLLKSLDNSDAYNGVECSSLSFLNTITGGDILEKRKNRPDSVDCTPPNYIMPGTKERSLLPLHSFCKDQKSPQCLKVLTTSGWNPPPGARKMHGDLIYLYVVTLEDKKFHITGCTHGFYINLSSEEEFNPKPANPPQIYHSLIELLNQISPGFKKNFANLQKKRLLRHPFERVVTPYQVYTWIAPTIEHSIDAIRAEDAFSSKLGYEEHIPGQTRDWNEELQTTRELPRKNLPERLLRERAIFKVHSDFVSASVRGAMAVVDGNVMAINPGEEAKMQMFIWNNIFFSLGFDVRDHYKDIGGDAAAYIAPVNDLQGVHAFSQVDLEGLYTLGTVVIDYRGYRITAQSIIPGILEREQDQSVIYGSIDFGKTVVTHSKYLEMLKKAGQQLRILPHKVLNEKNEEIELCSSVECKGIIGNDGRYYILDLLRTFPPDLNFLPAGIELSKEAQNMNFPKEHKHKLCCLRQELIEAFIEARYVLFIKYAAYHLQQLGGKKLKENHELESKLLDFKDSSQVLCNGTDNDLDEKTGASNMKADEAKKIMESLTEKEDELEGGTKDIICKAARAVGSLKDTEFYIAFNPDAFSPGVQFPESQKEQLKRERKLIQDASDFLISVQIPGFVKDFFDHSSFPLEGWSLTEAMHNRGVNMRYLGKVAETLNKFKHLDYAHNIAVTELICRSTKHLFKVYLQSVDMMHLSSAISHFLNCFIGNCLSPSLSVNTEEIQIRNHKKKGKRKNKQGILAFQGNTEWSLFTPRSLWQDINAELISYYDFKLECDSVETVIEKFSIQKISLLRQFCVKTGVQIMLKDYNFDNRQRQPFSEEDILNIFPVVKHINPRASDAVNFYSAGQTKIQQGAFREGFELITEALNLLNNVYGAMHPEIVQCLRMLARLNYILGDNSEALQYQEKAVLMSERVNGIDHPNTIIEYTHFALYCFANSQVSTALKLLYRARYLILLIFGENHPEVALLDSNIGLILHAVGEYDLSLRFLEKALQLNIRFYGAKSLKVAVSYHLVAQTQSCIGDFRSALQNEKETFAIYKQQLGEEHEKTKESSECLKHLTQQAVVFQKKINEMCKGTSFALFPPIHIQTPSIATVLDMLNIVNGILFVQISQHDIDEFRLEVERRQQQKKIDSESKPLINGNLVENDIESKLAAAT